MKHRTKLKVIQEMVIVINICGNCHLLCVTDKMRTITPNPMMIVKIASCVPPLDRSATSSPEQIKPVCMKKITWRKKKLATIAADSYSASSASCIQAVSSGPCPAEPACPLPSTSSLSSGPYPAELASPLPCTSSLAFSSDPCPAELAF